MMRSQLQRGTWILCGQPPLGSVRAYRHWPLLLLLCVVLSLTTGCVAPKDSSNEAASIGKVDTFQSGGLGLTLAEWERRYNLSRLDSPDPLSRSIEYAERHFAVALWADRSTGQDIKDALIAQIGFYSESRDPEGQHADARKFLPADAVLQTIYRDSSDRGGHIAVYHSKSLAARYPPLPSVPDPWGGEVPGTVRIGFARGITGVTAGLQDPPRPTEPPPTKTPFILLLTPEPTKPLPLPPLPLPSQPAPLPLPTQPASRMP